MSLVYFTPNLIEANLKAGPPSWRAFHSLMNLFGGNAATMDRTGTLFTPFEVKIVDPIPFDLKLPSSTTFSTLCIDRAKELLKAHRHIQLMYSGGLDSTCVLLAFRAAMKELGYEDWAVVRQLTILTTPEAQRENPVLWDTIIGKLNVKNATIALSNGRESILRIQGEHADQLFGSDRVMSNQWLIDAEFSQANVERFVMTVTADAFEIESITSQFLALASKSPRPIDTMRDFLWWVNFTSKWQSVTFRTLAFSDELVNREMSMDFVRKYHTTFFNTPSFQALAMSGTLKQWGEEVSPRSYKQAARDFILEQMPSMEYYCQNKVKVGSLYNVIRQTSIKTPFIGITPTNQVQSYAHPFLS